MAELEYNVDKKIEFIIGYDIDGVISLGVCPRPENSVIITGRSFQEAPETFALLELHNIKCPVYFAPWPFDEKSREKSGAWKGEMITRLKISRFFEDDPIQFGIIDEMTKLASHKPDLIRVQHNHDGIL